MHDAAALERRFRGPAGRRRRVAHHLEHGVDRLFGGVAGGGVAHAEQRNQARETVVRVVHHLALLDQPHPGAAAGNHRQQPAMDQAHVAVRQAGVGECLARILQERLEVPPRHLQLIGAAVVRVVAGPEHRHVAPRHHEQVAAVDHPAARMIVHHLAGDDVHRAREAGRRRALRGRGQIRKQRRGPRPRRVHDHGAADHKAFAGQPIFHPHAGHAAVDHQEALRLHIVRGTGAGVHRGQQERQRHPVGALHLVVVPERAAGHALGRDHGVEAQGLFARHDLAIGEVDAGVRQPVVAAACHRVVDCEQRAPGQRAAHRRAFGGDNEGQRPQQVRDDAREGPPLADEQPHLREVERGQRPQAAMQRLEIVEGGGGAEIVLVDDRDRQPALRRVPRRGDAVEAAAHHNHVKLRVRQIAEISLHRCASLYDRGL